MNQNAYTVILSDSIFTGDEKAPLISGYLVIEGERIIQCEEGRPSRELLSGAESCVDFRGKTVCPGLVDSHTHLIFGGSRENELAMKLAGASYMEIHKEGGIKSTVKATRQADEHVLREKALKFLESMLLHGTTTVEAKSGYGLDLETELRVLRVIRELDGIQAISLVPTYMGAHDIPKEFPNADAYADFMIETVMPQVKREGLAEFVDIFCEKGIFELETSRRIGEAAVKMGFGLKIHADEIEPMGGAGLAASLGAVSAEHLMAVSDEDIPKMAKSGTVAVLLPATSFFLMSPRFAPARKMLDAGVHVALASDFNPGSSPCENLQMAMTMACFKMKLQPLEILRAVTIEAARAIRREHEIGLLKPGYTADITVFDAKNPDYLLYHFGVNAVTDVFKKGRRVVESGRINEKAVEELYRIKNNIKE